MKLATVTALPTARNAGHHVDAGSPGDMWESVQRLRREYPGAEPEVIAARMVLNECLANDPRKARNAAGEIARQRAMLKTTLQNLLNMLDKEAGR